MGHWLATCNAVSIFEVCQNQRCHLRDFYNEDCSTIAYSGLHCWVPLILGNYHFEISKALVEGLGLWVSSLKVEYLEVTNNVATPFASPYSKDYRNHALLVFPHAAADRIAFRLYLKIQISKTHFLQNCAVAKMLCFTILSASLPCAIVSEMHVLKKSTRSPKHCAGQCFCVFPS